MTPALYQKIEPAPNLSSGTATITYSYDVLHRLSTVTYPDTSYDQFVYDSPVLGLQLYNLKGRLAEEYHIGAPPSPNGYDSESFSYDAMGRNNWNWQCILVGLDGCKATSATYNYDGSLASFTNFDGTTITYTVNSAGEATAAANGSTSLFSNGTYNSFGAETAANLGSTLDESFAYDNRGRSVQFVAEVTSNHGWLYAWNRQHWSYGYQGAGFAPNGDLLYGNDTESGPWAYTYDDFNRIASAACNGGTASGERRPSPGPGVNRSKRVPGKRR